MKILVTGGAGFIGSCFVRHMLRTYADYQIINLDLLTYAGNLENLADIEGDARYTFVQGDICDRKLVQELMAGVNACVHFAAESHVDRSITDPEAFIRTNVLGTQVLLDAARDAKVDRYIQISTDEVYGSLGDTGYFTEKTPLNPRSPYSASKAASDMLALAYHETYGLPVLVTRCSNNYGPHQYPEKLIPLFIDNLMNDIPVPIYGDGKNVRDWLYVYDHAEAVDRVLHHGRVGEVYNIGGHNEKTNLEITHVLLESLGKDESLIKYVTDRLGHDRRYAIDPTKISTELGWNPSVSFEQGINMTIEWYKNNRQWIQNIKAKQG